MEQQPTGTAAIKTYSFTVSGSEAPLRLDLAVSMHADDISRNRARKLIEIGAVWINGTRSRILSKKVFPGDEVAVHIGREGWEKYYEIDPANILYEDDWLLFYRKEPGIPTQGIICDDYNNLHAALLRYAKQKRPSPYIGLHHRLDQDTSGVVVFTLSPRINRSIHYQFKDHRVKKNYVALVEGIPDFEQKNLNSFISRGEGRYRCSDAGPGKPAKTVFTRLASFEGCALLRAEPETGRTHQIRLQLAHMGHPVLGDALYGGQEGMRYPRAMLHAEALTIFHPLKKQDVTITADMFDDMKELIAMLSGKKENSTD